MLPTLLDLRYVTLFSYTVVLAIALLAGVWVFEFRSKGLAPSHFIWGTLLSAILGARAMYVALQWKSYAGDWIRIVRFYEGGYVFYGGLIAGGIYFGISVARMKFSSKDRWLLFDSAALAVMLAHAIGRIGCLLAGCCYGKETDLPWAVEHLHPVQAYEALGLLVMFVVAFRFRRRGFVSVFYLIGYGILRLVNEIFFRGDVRERGTMLGVSPGLVLSLMLLVVGTVLGLSIWHQTGDKKGT